MTPAMVFLCSSGDFTGPSENRAEALVPGGPVAAAGATEGAHPLARLRGDAAEGSAAGGGRGEAAVRRGQRDASVASDRGGPARTDLGRRHRRAGRAAIRRPRHLVRNRFPAGVKPSFRRLFPSKRV